MPHRAHLGGAGWAVLTALLPVAVAAQEVDGLAGAWAGGSYESNLARSTGAQAAVGDWSLDLGALAGGAWASDTFLLGAGVNYRGQVFTTATELSAHAFGGHALATAALGEWWLVGLNPSAAYVAQTDAARNGARLNARGFVRVAPTDWLRVRSGYGYLVREAADPVFSTRTHEVSGTVQVEPTDRLQLSAGYAWLSGTDVIYLGSETGTASGGSGRRQGAGAFSSGTGALLVPQQVDSTSHVVTAGAEFTLPHGFFVALDGAWTRGLTPLGAWTSWAGGVQAGWDLPR